MQILTNEQKDFIEDFVRRKREQGYYDNRIFEIILNERPDIKVKATAIAKYINIVMPKKKRKLPIKIEKIKARKIIYFKAHPRDNGKFFWEFRYAKNLITGKNIPLDQLGRKYFDKYTIFNFIEE